MALNDVCNFTPGSLVCARGREWVVQPQSSNSLLKLRPLGGSDEDLVTLIPDLEFTQPEPATFPWPDPNRPGSHDAALLLRDALQLKLRAGAGPFRSFGNIAIEPRAYQLVPLLMALRQPTVRLLIADDVGIGKTIEAGLIVRELIDRGEISRLAVLCPPHLVEQWQKELFHHFHFKAVALTASSVARLEKNIPHGLTLFDHYGFVVMSLDYIKSERHREHFLSTAPECIVVDEAHTCTIGGKGRQLRFELLRRLADDEARHLIMLTATPHSGDDNAFHNLITLLKPEFDALKGLEPHMRKGLREELARHFVQRRRKDIEEWQDAHIFPRRLTAEITYSLTGAWGAFFDEVQEYCFDLAGRTEREGASGSRLIWYATLALMRCVASSPAAAIKALTTRLSGTPEEMEALAEEGRIIDGQTDDLRINDLEPAACLEESARLQGLIEKAHRLCGMGDPKLATLTAHLETLVDEGFRPVIFCRYVATAHYVADYLKQKFRDLSIEAVTGEYTPEEREERITALGETDYPLLVATDCLSEGVNLQSIFDAVVHYDLAWNPTRHEQREGRVDRFGQKKHEVRCTMLYGQDNPVDGFILNVILKKAEAIRRELGVLVPMPEDDARMNQALIKAALMKRKQRSPAQMHLDFGEEKVDLGPVEARWQDAMEKAKANRTVFAQRRIKPQEVLPEWQKQLFALGGEREVERFVKGACARLNAPLEPYRRDAYRLLPNYLPFAVRERLAQEAIDKPLAIDFSYPPKAGAQFIHRSHPLVALLADTLIESSLIGDTQLAARTAATITDAVDIITTVYLLRLRHQLGYTRRGETRRLMAEETVAMAARGRTQPQWLDDTQAASLMNVAAKANLAPEAATREIRQALDFLKQNEDKLEELARSRSEALLADHHRVREAARDIGTYWVQPCLPVDIIGVYVLLPEEL
ncbi:MAG: helicase-related protein [Pseudomonadota bacterium]|nr:helicase-related protein [Pseudomonadota bacterium]